MYQLTKRCVDWIADFFKSAGRTTAVVGVSGGKDSAVCAALCGHALGPKNVSLVYIPEKHDEGSKDWDCILRLLKTPFKEYDDDTFDSPYIIQLEKVLKDLATGDVSESKAFANIKARLRMTLLYGYAQAGEDTLVCNTSNLDERLMGYSTLWGDSAGDFSPLGLLHVSEVVALGEDLGLPVELVERPPEDGLSGKTDEEALGFSYADVEYVFETLCQSAMRLVRSGCGPLSIGLPEQVPLYDTANSDIRQRIKRVLDRYAANRFKQGMINMPMFAPEAFSVSALVASNNPVGCESFAPVLTRNE